MDLSHNSITDISALARLHKLETLLFDYNQVKALPQWDKTCALVTIQGSHNKITSVTALGGLRNLNNVILTYNSLTNVDALVNCPSLVWVDIEGNKVKNVSKLTEMGVRVNVNPA
jgi:internalin A